MNKTIDEFGLSKDAADGRNRYCLECLRKVARESYKRNAEKLRQRAAERYANDPTHRAKRSAMMKAYRLRKKAGVKK